MEKLSKYSWVLIGHQPNDTSNKPDEHTLARMLELAFEPGREFSLFLCGAFVDKTGTLEMMEEGLDLLIEKMEDYQEGDYCIVSKHPEGNLLFLPIENKEDDNTETLSRNTDSTEE